MRATGAARDRRSREVSPAARPRRACAPEVLIAAGSIGAAAAPDSRSAARAERAANTDRGALAALPGVART